MILAELEVVEEDILMVLNHGNSPRTVTANKLRSRLSGGVRTTIMARDCIFVTLLLIMMNDTTTRRRVARDIYLLNTANVVLEMVVEVELEPQLSSIMARYFPSHAWTWK